MSYDLQTLLLQQESAGGVGGVESPGAAGSPTVSFPDTFNNLLFSCWFCTTDIWDVVALMVGGSSGSHGCGIQLFLWPDSGGTVSPSALAVGDGANDGTQINFDQPLQPTTTGPWNLLLSIDAASQVAQIYFNDTPLTISSSTWTVNTIASQAGKLGLNLGAAFEFFDDPTISGALGDVYIGAPASFFDLSIEANRLKFHDAFNLPVDLGTDASSVTGTSPQIYLSIRSGDPPSAILTNRGTGGGGTFETSGAPVAGHCTLLPLPPSPFCGAFHTASGFTAAWTPNPFGGTPTGYEVQYRKAGDPDFILIPDIMAESVFIGGLLDGTSYEFQVLAANDDGDSDFSDSAFCSTGTVVVPVLQPVPLSLGRWRGQVGLNWKGMALVGDAFDNVVGLSDFNVFTEYGNTMRFLVTTPPVNDDRKRIFVSRFELEVESGQGNPADPGVPPVMILDVSKDGGITFISPQIFRSMGAVGEYIKRLRWLNLGVSRTWVFRIQCTDPVRRYIIGAYIDDYKGLG